MVTTKEKTATVVQSELDRIQARLDTEIRTKRTTWREKSYWKKRKEIVRKFNW